MFNIGSLDGYFIAMIILFVISIVLLIIYLSSRKNNFHGDYDERQKIARGNAYKYAFITLSCYVIISAVIITIFGTKYDAVSCAFIGVIISSTVYAIICIFKEAYLPLKDKPVFIIITLIISSAFWSIVGFDNLAEESMIENPYSNLSIPFFVMGIMQIITLICFIIKLMIDKHSLKRSYYEEPKA